jgi:hypothetical protein
VAPDRLRHFASLEYADPRGYLIELRKLEPRVAASGLPLQVRTLRTNQLKGWREAREAALFCHFMSERIGTSIRIARQESQDYDFVATWTDGDTQKFAPVQLKEVVPTHLNPRADISSVIENLARYRDSSDLTIAIHLNQTRPFDAPAIQIPELHLAGLWVFSSISPDASRWGLWGDLLKVPLGTEHAYPAA